MFNILSKLIKKRFYADRETATAKVDTAFAMIKITESQYVDLQMLINEYYPAVEE